MPFDNQTEYPRGLFYTNSLGGGTQHIGEQGKNKLVSHYVIRGGSSLVTLMFRNSAATFIYKLFPVYTDELIVVPNGFYADQGGLAVRTSPSGGGNVTLILHYFDS